jgi:hypothetical protein
MHLHVLEIPDLKDFSVLRAYVPTLLTLAWKFGGPTTEASDHARVALACQALELLRTLLQLDRSLVGQLMAFAAVRSLVTQLLVGGSVVCVCVCVCVCVFVCLCVSHHCSVYFVVGMACIVLQLVFISSCGIAAGARV